MQDCPVEDNQDIDCFTNKFVTSCEDGHANYTDVNNTMHYVNISATDNVLNRFCVPLDTEKNDAILNSIEKAHFTSFGADIAKTWELVLLILGIAVGISAVYIFVLRFFLKAVIWASFVALITMLICFGYLVQKSAETTYNTDDYQYTRIGVWCAAILLYALALLFLIISVCIKEKIELAVAIMKSAVIFIEDVWTSLLVPFVIIIIGVGILAL